MTFTSNAPAGARQTIDESYPAVPDSVAQARYSMARWLRGLSADALMSGDVGLAIAEACNNVVIHGFPRGACGAFRVPRNAWTKLSASRSATMAGASCPGLRARASALGFP